MSHQVPLLPVCSLGFRCGKYGPAIANASLTGLRELLLTVVTR